MQSRETLRLEQLVQKTSASLVNHRDRLAKVIIFVLPLIGIH